MSKVLVDRELLELLRNFTFLHDDGCAGVLRGNIDKALAAQPAEAEGVELTGEYHADCNLLLAALSAVTAERDGLAAARMAYANEFAPVENGDPDVGNVHANIRALKAERDRLRAVLEGAQYPNIDRLKTLTIEQCRQVGETVMRLTIDAQSERDQLRAEVEELRKDADRWRYVRLQGDDTHWLNLLRVDLDEFGGNINAAVDALIDGEAPAMAAKEG